MANALHQHAAGALNDRRRKSVFAMPARHKASPPRSSSDPRAGKKTGDARSGWLWPGWLRRGGLHLLLAAPFAPRRAVLRDLGDRLGRGCPPDAAGDPGRSAATGNASPCRVLLGIDDFTVPARLGTWTEAAHLADLYVTDGTLRAFDPEQDGAALRAFQKKFRYDLLVLPLALDRMSESAAVEQLSRASGMAVSAGITPLIVTPPRRNARRRPDRPLTLNDLPHQNRISERVDTVFGLSGGGAGETGEPTGCFWHHLHHPHGPSRAMRIDTTAADRLTWCSIVPSKVGQRAAADGPRVTASPGSVDRAVGFLQAMLDQPRPRNEVFERAKSLGISDRALWAAAKRLNVRSHRVGFGPDGRYYWTRAA